MAVIKLLNVGGANFKIIEPPSRSPGQPFEQAVVDRSGTPTPAYRRLQNSTWTFTPPAVLKSEGN